MSARRSKPTPSVAAPTQPHGGLAFVVMMVTGLLVRLLISIFSHGTNDAAAFYTFGAKVAELGFLPAYAQVPYLNHPPLVLAWAWAAYSAVDGSEMLFPFVFKLPIILCEGGIAWLVWRIWQHRAPGERQAAMYAAAGYSLSPASILVSAYHCNTDTIYAGLTLLAIYLLEDHRRPLLAGLALGAAINIKLVPVLFIPVMLLSLRTKRDAARFLIGLLLAAIPFLPVLLAAGEAYYRNAIAYGSRLDKWGIQLLLLPSGEALPAEGQGGWADVYFVYGRYVMLGAIVAWAAVARWIGRWDRYEAVAVAASLFLLLAPGFAVQYAAVPVPLLLIARRRLANAYALVAGVFLAVVYFTTLQPSPQSPAFPLFSMFVAAFKSPAPAIGAIAWLVLAITTAVIISRPSASQSSAHRA